MDTWYPIAQEQLEQIIKSQFIDCTPEQQEVFQRYRIPLRLAPIERYGKVENVFIVAQRDNEVMYYEDVEEGFNFSPLAEDGRILEHWCNQDELKYALWHWLGSPKKIRLGPAEPIKK